MVDKYNYWKEYYRIAQLKHKVKSLLKRSNADELKKLCSAIKQLKQIKDEKTHKSSWLTE